MLHNLLILKVNCFPSHERSREICYAIKKLELYYKVFCNKTVCKAYYVSHLCILHCSHFHEISPTPPTLKIGWGIVNLKNWNRKQMYGGLSKAGGRVTKWNSKVIWCLDFFLYIKFDLQIDCNGDYEILFSRLSELLPLKAYLIFKFNNNCTIS